MTDLSLPPLELTPLPDGPHSGAALAVGLRGPSGEFLWPSPPYVSYPPPQAQTGQEECEIEGLNGKVMKARLTMFDPDHQLIHVQVPPSRTTMPLRFDQFRRLVLTTPLRPIQTQGHDDPLMQFSPQLPYTVHLADTGSLDGETVGHVEDACGLFLFSPVDGDAGVLRQFCPRPAYSRYNIGKKLGELLVDDRSATPQEIAKALKEQKKAREETLGDMLVAQQIVGVDQLKLALDEQARMPMMRIGEALTGLGYITAEQLDKALEEQKAKRGAPLGEILLRNSTVTEEQLRAALARKMGYPVVDVRAYAVEIDALRKIPVAAADRLRVLPLQILNGRLVVAIEDPSRRDVIDELEFLTQAKIVPVLPGAGQLDGAIAQQYQRAGLTDGLADLHGALNFDLDGTDRLLADLEQTPSTRDGEDEALIEQSDNTLVRLINTMIVEAHNQGVSDIHIETHPGRGKLNIRFRRDGVLKPYLSLPHTYRNAFIARLKIMCDLDISERRRPQDGKINFARFVQTCPIELRVATIPTANGLEDAVLRVLASAKPIPLGKLGMSEHNLSALKEAIERPYGLVLCVGPTGSGKTTTLHSALSHINVPERKIWTAEDPVEITQPGLRQVQVNPKIDWTFAKALRAFLRADPDVIMVGEIRDEETAKIAVESSLTGHLVLSTLHTNSAAETVTRLLDMGLDPFSFADSLLAVLAQRLVRRTCSACRTSRPATAEEIDQILQVWLHPFGDSEHRPSPDTVLADWRERLGKDGVLHWHRNAGCPQCEGSGLKGRAGLHELLVASPRLRRMVQTGARAEEIQQVALVEGMRTLRQDGLEKVLLGVTTIDEVRATSNA